MTKSLTSAPWEPKKRVVRGNAAEQVLEDLRHQILDGTFPRGSKLPTEKQLGLAYGISSNTIREAIRGLTAAHLVEVKHGSGAYVTGNAEQLIARSLRSILQVGRIGIEDIFNTYGAFYEVAAEAAAQNATPELISELQAAQDAIGAAIGIDKVTAAVVGFLDVVAKGSGNMLLTTFCGFLARLQADLFREMSSSLRKDKAPDLTAERQALVDAIRAKNPERARTAARSYETRALEFLLALPKSGTHSSRKAASGDDLSRALATLLQDEDAGLD